MTRPAHVFAPSCLSGSARRGSNQRQALHNLPGRGHFVGKDRVPHARISPEVDIGPGRGQEGGATAGDRQVDVIVAIATADEHPATDEVGQCGARFSRIADESSGNRGHPSDHSRTPGYVFETEARSLGKTDDQDLP